jgi:hypothetical protein
MKIYSRHCCLKETLEMHNPCFVDAEALNRERGGLVDHLNLRRRLYYTYMCTGFQRMNPMKQHFLPHPKEK